MKQLYNTAILMFLFATGYAQTVKEKSFAASTNKNSFDQAWLNEAQHLIKEGEYYFKKDDNSLNFQVINKAQQIGFFINSKTHKIFPIKQAKKNNSSWEQSISFVEISRGNTHLYANNKFTCLKDKSNLSFCYTDFNIEYSNTEKGLRQNFIVTRKPSGNQNLEVLLNAEGSLSPSVLGNGLQFKDKAGNTKLYYTDLNVWDADHNTIAASMELRDENTIAIVVKDQHAKYPLTIDPINQTPEWATSGDGILPDLIGQLAVDAAYGFSVAGLGDVNGDGFDDVAVGAPTSVDVISPTVALANVGAVYIYFGGSGGLSTTPSAVLKPTTPVAGALFGYSIAGGDINADEQSDIVIGAPMDVVTVSIGGGATASGTVGKVYVYDGATLSTGSNPLLTLSLNGNGILDNNINLSVNALFGFSVAVTQDLNADDENDIIVGAPTYAGIKTVLGISLLDVQSGGAFVFLSNGTDPRTLVKLNPYKTSLLGLGLLSNNINGLLFGYSVDGLGDYNSDNKYDVVVGAPAGINLSSLGGLANGKLLQGSAIVYYGTGSGINTNPGATLTATSGGLITNLIGSVANLANLFGTSVKGVKNSSGIRNGNVLVGAPLGGAIINVLGLDLKAGTVSVFKKKSSSPGGYVIPNQIISSPRNSNTVLGVIQANLLFGFSLDNVLDVNCDGWGDIIVGEPASSGVQLLNANVSGGAAYVYLGKSDGTYQASPSWTFTATEDEFLSVNATSLIGYSVAGAGHVNGDRFSNKILIGTPSRTLDFGAGLLNIGGTLGTLFSLVTGDNGVGKAYLFNTSLCSSSGPLPIIHTALKGSNTNGSTHLTWTTTQEINSNYFEIERSKDGIHFNYIGKVNAAGNSNTEMTYQFDDDISIRGLNYYRFKLIDQNGRYIYSNIILLDANIKGSFITTIYPSPFIDKVNIHISTDANGIANTKLFDNIGRLVVDQQSVIQKGINNIVLDKLINLSSGSYIIQVQIGEKIIAKKLIK